MRRTILLHYALRGIRKFLWVYWCAANVHISLLVIWASKDLKLTTGGWVDQMVGPKEKRWMATPGFWRLY